jgi:hypothetical protein
MLVIYLPQLSTRHQYIFDRIFMSEFGIEYKTTDDELEFESHKEEKINYSGARFQDELFIKATSLLSEKSVRKFDIEIGQKGDNKILFPNEESCDIGFDIFSAVFYMLSRYEEYLSFTSDRYGRFKAEDSLAYKHDILSIPIVDKWLEILKHVLQKKFPGIKCKSSKFEKIVTYDIDVAFKFKGRNLVRNAGSTLKDLLKFDLENILERFQILGNKKADPWDTYDYLRKTIADKKLQSIFFFLMGDHSTYDRNLDYRNRVMNSLINKIKQFSEIGIHPSFRSSLFIEKIAIEKHKLEKIADKKITKSRQHFLKFTLPDTYNALVEAGIDEDYSMGFPYTPGFRAGTSKPFYFYDLKNEKATHLKIFPITLMEGNFTESEYPDKKKISEKIFDLIDEVKNVHGTFISIWHNHTVSDTTEYTQWRNIHDQMIEKITSILSNS